MIGTHCIGKVDKHMITATIKLARNWNNMFYIQLFIPPHSLGNLSSDRPSGAPLANFVKKKPKTIKLVFVAYPLSTQH